jgi:Family of unknown function (DUF6529)
MAAPTASPAATGDTTSTTSVPARVLGVLAAGAAVAILLGVYANEHTPTKEKPYTLVFTDTIQLKVWFATAAAIFAVVQVLLALRMYGKIHVPRTVPPWLGDAHRLTGIVVFALTLPVAYHCLWSLGYQSVDMAGEASKRVLAHSIAGCFFYGAFVTKVLSVRVRGLPGWMLPVVGGLVFSAIVVLFVTSCLWYYVDRPAGFPLF